MDIGLNRKKCQEWDKLKQKTRAMSEVFNENDQYNCENHWWTREWHVTCQCHGQHQSANEDCQENAKKQWVL